MFYLSVSDGESANDFAFRAERPLCMLLRANGLISGAWVLPGREMMIPDACGEDGFPCPMMLFAARIPALEGYILREGESASDAAAQKGIPERIVHCAMKEKSALGVIYLPVREKGMRMHTCRVSDTWKIFHNEADLRLLNRCWGKMYPGMKILVYGDE